MLLEENELKRKDKLTGKFLDLCNTCYKVSNETLIEYDSEIPNDADKVNLDDYL